MASHQWWGNWLQNIKGQVPVLVPVQALVLVQVLVVKIKTVQIVIKNQNQLFNAKDQDCVKEDKDVWQKIKYFGEACVWRKDNLNGEGDVGGEENAEEDWNVGETKGADGEKDVLETLIVDEELNAGEEEISGGEENAGIKENVKRKMDVSPLNPKLVHSKLTKLLNKNQKI